MDFSALSSQFEELKDLTAETFPQYTGLLTAVEHARETKRPDALHRDPYAEMLAGPDGYALSELILGKVLQARAPRGENKASWYDIVAIRSCYVDQALEHRREAIKQVVVLGAGLDTRAFHLESLKDCIVFELDSGARMLDRKTKIFAEHDVKPVAKAYHQIVADLAVDGWAELLQAKGFDPNVPTFWLAEGVVPYLKQNEVVGLLEKINAYSAPESQFWCEINNPAMVARLHAGSKSPFHASDYGEQDPLHGVLTTTHWDLEMQADLTCDGQHFGRAWESMKHEGQGAGSFYIVSTKPATKP